MTRPVCCCAEAGTTLAKASIAVAVVQTIHFRISYSSSLGLNGLFTLTLATFEKAPMFTFTDRVRGSVRRSGRP
jgi:hypothetical protein